MNRIAEQARYYRTWYRCLAELLDDALAEAERVAEADGGLGDFQLNKFGKLLIDLGQGATALHKYVAERLEAAEAQGRRPSRRRP